MSVTHRRFPTRESVLSDIGVENIGDITNAKKSLASILSPLVDVLAAYKSIDMIIALAEKLPSLEDMKEALTDEIEEARASLSKTREDARKFNLKQDADVKIVTNKITELASELASITEQVGRARGDQDKLNRKLADEHSVLTTKMKADIEEEERIAREELTSLTASISDARKELQSLARKKKAFIDSLL
jgi:chromosome segregation ATPase